MPPQKTQRDAESPPIIFRGLPLLLRQTNVPAKGFSDIQSILTTKAVQAAR
jgi:hypothetical protein